LLIITKTLPLDSKFNIFSSVAVVSVDIATEDGLSSRWDKCGCDDDDDDGGDGLECLSTPPSRTRAAAKTSACLCVCFVCAIVNCSWPRRSSSPQKPFPPIPLKCGAGAKEHRQKTPKQAATQKKAPN